MFQTLVQVAVYATILGVFITIAAWINGRRTTKAIKEIITSEGNATRELIEKLIERTNKLIASESNATREVITSEGKATRELIERMNQLAEQRHCEVIQLVKTK